MLQDLLSHLSSEEIEELEIRGKREKGVPGTYREFLGIGKFYSMAFDCVESSVRSVPRVWGRGGGQGHVGLPGLGDLDPPDGHQLHQLK